MPIKLINLLAIIFTFYPFLVRAEEGKIIKMRDSPLSVTVPNYLDIVNSAYQYDPELSELLSSQALRFSLPPLENGETPMYPRFLIEYFEPDEPLNVNTIKELEEVISTLGDNDVVPEYKKITIGKWDAIEIKGEGETISHGAKGEVFYDNFLTYVLVIEHDEKLYICSMDASDEDYEKHLATAKKLCYSIRFD